MIEHSSINLSRKNLNGLMIFGEFSVWQYGVGLPPSTMKNFKAHQCMIKFVQLSLWSWRYMATLKSKDMIANLRLSTHKIVISA